MSETKTTRTPSACPDAEVIGAYFDGELSKETPEAIHIAACPECAKVIAAYDLTWKALKGKLAIAVPGDLESRILASVKSRVKPSSTILFPAVALRIAAVVAVLLTAAIVFVMLWNEGGGGSDLLGAKTVAVGKEGKAAPTPFPPTMTAAPEFSARPAGKPAVSGDVTLLPNLRPASFGIRSYEGGATDSGKPASIASIGDSVRQVWVVNNLEQRAAEFPRLVKAVGGACGQPVLQKDRTELRASLTKAQLVNLIRRCAAAGFKLTSPEQPQPEQEHFSDGSDEPVAYCADLVAE